ncbi:MAG TPA: EutN/CcmL family microcompartment protein [Firmicutes bacterium]|nr:EutN/CcmL family microcompartment protein [Bacillota bacterium]
MLIAQVKGNIWATRKEDALKGYKLLVVQPVDVNGKPVGNVLVAADRIGAGEGELVLVVGGSSARMATEGRDVPVDATVVAIIDTVELKKVNMFAEVKEESEE